MTHTGLVVFDRDGVLNELLAGGKGQRGPWSLDELTICPGAAETVTALSAAGYSLVVATNQPDVARGWMPAETMHSINARIGEMLPELGTFYVCAHDSGDGCDCRKPQPGMLLRALSDTGADAAHSWMIGDRDSDIAAGEAAGFRTIHITAETPIAAVPAIILS